MGDYPDSGALFTNKNKTSEKAPDYSGDIEIGSDTLRYLVGQAKASKDTTLRIAGWKRQGKSGATFLSLKLSVPQQQQQQERKPERKRADDLDDDIPF